MAYEAKIICDSVSPSLVRLTTMQVTFPRIVLAEFNTHRMFSRNSASSRAIPVEKRIAAIEADPFIPEAFGKNQKGMQASEQLRDSESRIARLTWEIAMNNALQSARDLSNIGVHKQLANRLIEPFCWHTVIVTATEWDNFFGLRCNKDAQPEIRRVAEMMREAYDCSLPVKVESNGWHVPYMLDLDWLQRVMSPQEIARVSAARCARVSYLTHDGQRDVAADLQLADRLQSSGHMSPFEHVAQPAPSGDAFFGNFRGWIQLRKTFRHESNFLARTKEIA